MFEEPPNNTDNFDVVTEPRDAWSKQAEAADDQLDLDASSGGKIEGLNDVRVFKLIHFGPNSGGVSVGRMFCFFVDQSEKRRLHGLRSEEYVVELFVA